VFADFPWPWFVAGGWAIDLFVGAVTREHEDVEVAILRDDQGEVHRFLSAWTLDRLDDRHEVGASVWVPWNADERIESPDFQAQARRSGVNPLVIDLFFVDAPHGSWRFRRDPRITRPVAEIGAHAEIGGIPFIVPEIELLYKAKYHRPKDEHDFERALPCLDAPQRLWLREALRVNRPDDPWVTRLG
jgi:hypothetical protein